MSTGSRVQDVRYTRHGQRSDLATEDRLQIAPRLVRGRGRGRVRLRGRLRLRLRFNLRLRLRLRLS